MITEGQVKAFLIEKLATVYPMPARKDAIAREVAARCPEWVTEESLEDAASRMIATRKARTFPSPAELITVARSIPSPGARRQVRDEALDCERKHDEAEQKAFRMLRGMALAERALSERWGPALIGFVTEHEREPDLREQQALIAKSRRNDIDARDCGKMSGAMVQLRESMHAWAERQLRDGIGLRKMTA